jgi:hypothetical protein
MRNFRKLFRWLVPGWLSTGEGEKVLYSLSRVQDAYLTLQRARLEARFPSRTGSSCNARTGLDRGIRRGRNETNAHYAQRLIGWRGRRGHQVRGNAFALLNQVSEYFGGVRCYTIDVKGTRNERAADGAETTTFGNAWNWDGVWVYGEPAYRYWLVIDLSTAPGAPYSAYPPVGDPTLWGGVVGATDISLGIEGMRPDDAVAIDGLQAPPHSWKPAGTHPEYVIYSLTGADPVPDGTWYNRRGRQDASAAGFRFGKIG